MRVLPTTDRRNRGERTRIASGPASRATGRGPHIGATRSSAGISLGISLLTLGASACDPPEVARKRDPTGLARRPAAASQLETPQARASDTTALKALLDYYVSLDRLVHPEARRASGEHEADDALLADLDVEDAKQVLRDVLERRYAVVYEGRSSSTVQRQRPPGDSMLVALLVSRLEEGKVMFATAGRVIQGGEAATLVAALTTAHETGLQSLVSRHRGLSE